MKQLRKILLRLKGEFMTEDGSGVNYNLMGKSDAFHAYKNLASNLRLDFYCQFKIRFRRCSLYLFVIKNGPIRFISKNKKIFSKRYLDNSLKTFFWKLSPIGQLFINYLKCESYLF